MLMIKIFQLAACLILVSSLTSIHQVTVPSGTYQIDPSNKVLSNLSTKITFDSGRVSFR